MVLIGLVGSKGVGKTTLANMIQASDPSFKVINFADSLKICVGALFGLNDEQLHGGLKDQEDDNWKLTPRQIMQSFGTDVLRRYGFTYFGRNLFIEAVKKKIGGNTIIADVRFEDEADFIIKNGGILIKIHRPNINNQPDNHQSETNQFAIRTQLNFINNGDLFTMQVYAQQITAITTVSPIVPEF